MAELAVNGAQSTLATAPSGTSGTSLAIQSGDTGKFPSSGNFACILQDSLTSPTQYEIIEVTAVSGATFTITRASEAYAGSQTAQTWSAGAYITQVATAGTIKGVVGTAFTSANAGEVLTVLGASRCADFEFFECMWVAPPSTSVTGTFSLMAWIKATTLGPEGENDFIASRQPSDFGMAFRVSGGPTLGLLVGNGAGWITTSFTASAPNILDGSWHCCAAVVTPTGATIYLDGSSIGSTSYSGTPDLLDSTHGLQVGGYGMPNLGEVSGAVVHEAFLGQVAHVAIFTSALTTTQISDLYSNAAGDTESAYETYVNSLSPDYYYPLQESSGGIAANSGSVGSSGDGYYFPRVRSIANGPVGTSLTPTIGWAP